MNYKGLDPKTLKVGQLRRVLVENGVTFPANARKPALVKLFEENVRQRLESSSKISKAKDSIQRATKSEAKNTDRKKTLKIKKLETSSTESKTARIENVETKKRAREQISTDNIDKAQGKEEKSPKKKRKKRSSKASKALGSPSKSKVEKEETSVTLTSEVKTEDNKMDPLNVKLTTGECTKPELPNLKVSNEFLVQLNKELASAATENYDHSIKTKKLSSIRAKRKGSIDASTETEARNKSVLMENNNKEVQDELKAVMEKLVKNSQTPDNEDKKISKKLLSKTNKPSPKGYRRYSLANKTKRVIDTMRPFVAHALIWLWNIALYLLIVLPLLFGLWYREQRIRIGYCGHEKSMKSLALSAFPQTERVDEFLKYYRPDCLQCPKHGKCSSFMNVECESGYELRSSILETYGIFPFPKYCAKDESKEKEVDELVWKVSELLRKKNARIDCGEGKNLFESGETGTKLYDIFSHSRPSWENQREFNEHWKNVLEILKSKEEIVWLPLDHRTDGKAGRFESNDTDYVFRSNSKKWVKLQCHLETSIQDFIKKYGGPILAILGVLFIIKKIQSTLDDYVQAEQIIEKMVKEAIDKLKSVKKNEDEQPFLTTVQLRTILLRDISSIKEQNSLWAQTKNKIIKEQSENIELYLLEENGEIMTCWEWKE
ncbi:hypothetical protein SMKI_04G6530 [Saccharomyces mikatae IFO 1815]|uniref:Heh2p n=1 Tax=Saccharomyces mikatae IFO 1815 TaxID=226126 RepID=A0AA35NHK3_SACMI|nr:uncharacterized protein SMKI_04G6530 [Saccharomyces mikatae IFO 1815]CAI4038310.1 hypothetical protein SMKI_04G6530 [Saccharomyces mikatae IFO 1815]